MKILGKLLLAFMLLAFVSSTYAGEHKGDKKRRPAGMEKTTTNDIWDFISVNNILMWVSNNGALSHNPQTDGSGLEWPQGSAKYAIFADGLVWGGKVQGDIRVGGSTYSYGHQAGPVKGDGTAADPADPRYRIYKIRKLSSSTYATFSANDQMVFRTDFMEWPTADGAPWVDKNNNGIYEPDFNDYLANGAKSTYDTPFFIGDEVLWFVTNDLDNTRTTKLYGTPPVGMEIHTMIWGYNQTGPLGNMVFIKYKFINKGTDDYTDAYVSMWSDPDLGDAGDDLVGVDTVLSMGYTYNGYAKDGTYGIPPAHGYDFFQGPLVPGDPADIGIFNFGKRAGYKNLGVASFAFYINSSSVYADPELGATNGATEMYFYQTGFLWDGTPFTDPTTGLTTKFALAGDPLTQKGWVDGIVNAPDDRRLLMTAGPFTLAVKDTQEVVVSSMIALGSDRLSSLVVLKYYDRFAQLAFDNNFVIPEAPPSPKLKAVQLPGKFILNWGDPASVAAIENFSDAGFSFEGYNVYQVPGQSATAADAKLIATFDKENAITTIFDEVVDERSGDIVQVPVQFGQNTGLKSTLELTKDFITDRPLVNNQPYYYAVTSYSYNPDPAAAPRQLESPMQIQKFSPQTTNPGQRFTAQINERLNVTHTQGKSYGTPLVEVVDPAILTGDSYEVTFSKVRDVTIDYLGDTLVPKPFHAWNLTNLGTNEIPVEKSESYNGLTSGFFIVDGFKIGVEGTGIYQVLNEIFKEEYVPKENNVYGNVLGHWLPAYDFFGSSIPGYTIENWKKVEVRLNKGVTSKGYNYLRGGSPSYGYTGYFDSPITVWDVTDPANERQLMWAFVENNGDAANNQRWGPRYGGLGGREYLFIFDETYSDTPNPKYTGTWRILQDGGEAPVLYAAWLQQDSDYGSEHPFQDGDKIVLTPNIPFASDDKFTFTTPKPSYSQEIAKTDVSKINVFPNPYLGANEQELNKYQRFVTFNHLPAFGDEAANPAHAHFRIYTTSGTLVRSFHKQLDGTQTANWDLLNDNGLPVGSGMYIIHIDMPELGIEKVLKLGIVSEAQFLDRI